MNDGSPLEQIRDLYLGRGDTDYFGEDVTQMEHALQSAWFARQDKADPATVIAALLHDIGHLIHQRGQDIAERGLDAQHERIGAKWLARWLGPEVTEPIRLHVDAKRHLCARVADYAAQLSSASQLSLRLQGGPMSEAECRRFEAEEWWRHAVQLRGWDDRAKVIGLQVPAWETYEPELAQLIVAGRRL